MAAAGAILYCSTGTVLIFDVVKQCQRRLWTSTTDRRTSGVDLVTVLQALSDPVRLEIVRQLAGCDPERVCACGQIELEVTKSTASHHLKALRCAGITAEREEGTRATPGCAGTSSRSASPACSTPS